MATRTRNRIKAVVDFVVTDTSVTPGIPFVLPNPGEGATLNPGFDVQLDETYNAIGNLAVEDIRVTAERPVLTLPFPGMSPIVTSLRLNRKFVSSTIDSPYQRNKVKVTSNSFPALSSGQDGYDVAEDVANAVMSKENSNGTFAELTQATFSGFDNAGTTDSFAVGANGAIEVSDNLIGEFVSWSIPQPTTGLDLGETPWTSLSVSVIMVTTELKKFRVTFPNAKIDLADSGEIPLGPDTVNLSVRSIFDGSNCQLVKIEFLELVRAC